MPTTPLQSPRQRRNRFLRSVLPLLFDLLLVVVLTILDIRDLFYKVSWIGPYDSFSFTAVSSRTFNAKPAVTVKNFTASDLAVAETDTLLSETTRQSGWPSLLTHCESFYPAGASLFIGGMGHNCVVFNQSSTAVVVPKLYMSASLRADSMAWAACKLLYRHRKPAVCHDQIVTGFLDRYGFQDREVTRAMKVLPFSNGEYEVLGVLRVIAKSEPLTRATCFEGFAYEGPALYRTSLFGCGAPNSMDSAFVGTYATAFPDLHRDKAWLTVDVINLMGFKYIMRQNVKSEFPATLNAQTGAVELAPKTITNFSSSGGLYNLMICIDVVLLAVNLWSSIEIARLMILPVLTAHVRALRGEPPEPTADADGQGQPAQDQTMRELVEDYTTGFSTSLYRSRPIVLALAASQLLSWVIVLPNSVIFTWSTGSRWAKIQAYLSCIRLWSLVLMLVNEIWDLVVLLDEKFAYAVASRTYISTYEIIAVGAAVSYEMRQDVFGVGNTKYAMELQRTKDTTSYAKLLTLQNAYNEALDFQLNTPVDIVWTMYKPLFNIIGWSLFFCVVVLVVRFLFHRFVMPIINHKLRRKTTYATTSKILAATAQGDDGAVDGAIDADAAEAEEIAQLLASGYARLPLEEQLNDPIRARCLVRVSFEMEAIRRNTATKALQRYILPAYFLEHGVVVDEHGELHTRHGFFKFLEPRIQFDGCMPVETAEAMRKIASLRKRTSALAATVVHDKTK